jgi:hypothetical protein
MRLLAEWKYQKKCQFQRDVAPDFCGELISLVHSVIKLSLGFQNHYRLRPNESSFMSYKSRKLVHFTHFLA